MDEKELNERCRNIPIAILRKKYPNIHSRSKQHFIGRIHDEVIDELKSLALYYSMKWKKSVFLIRVKIYPEY